MIKKISALVMAAVLAASMSACSMPQNIFTDNLGVGNNQTGKNYKNEVYDFEFTLDGHNYYLPASFEHFADLGWSMKDPSVQSDAQDAGTAEESEAEMLEVDDYTDYFDIYNDKYKVSIKLHNDKGEAAPLEECSVVGLKMDAISNAVPYLQLNGDVKFGDSYAEVKQTYGAPSFEKSFNSQTGELVGLNDMSMLAESDANNEGENDIPQIPTTNLAYYYIDSHSFAEFTFGEISGIKDGITKVTLENNAEPEEKYNRKKDKDKAPDLFALYQEPALLGTSINDFSFKYENTLYTLPMPVSKLIDNGWIFVKGSTKKVLAGHTADGIVLRKDNKFIEIMVHNYDPNSNHSVINCHAVSLSCSEVGSFANIMLPQGITLGTTEEELIKTYRINDDKANTQNSDSKVQLELSETSEYKIYSYVYSDYVPTVPIPKYISNMKDVNVKLLGSHRNYIDIYVSKLNNKVVSIYLQNAPEYVLDETKIWEEYVAEQEALKAEAEKLEQETDENQ